MLFLMLVVLISGVNGLPIYVKPLDANGDIQPNTQFTYLFYFTKNSDCTNIYLSNTSVITTGNDGVGFVDIDITSMTNIPSYLCEYKGGVLRKVHTLADGLYRNIYADTINVTNNVTADYFKGSINYSDVDNVPTSSFTSTYNETYDTTSKDVTANRSNWESTYNQTYHDYVQANMSNESEYWDTLDTYNVTQMEDSGGVLNILESWFTNLWNAIFGTKDTDDLTEGSTNLYDDTSWNKTYADTLYAPTGYGDDWNETYADTKYVQNDTDGGYHIIADELNVTGESYVQNVTSNLGTSGERWGAYYLYNQTFGMELINCSTGMYVCWGGDLESCYDEHC